MTDSLKERLRRHVQAGTDGVWMLCEEALARIEELEAEVEAWAGQTNKELDCNENLRATIAKLEGEIERLKQESNYWQMAAMHANEREEEAQATIAKLDYLLHVDNPKDYPA